MATNLFKVTKFNTFSDDKLKVVVEHAKTVSQKFADIIADLHNWSLLVTRTGFASEKYALVRNEDLGPDYAGSKYTTLDDVFCDNDMDIALSLCVIAYYESGMNN